MANKKFTAATKPAVNEHYIKRDGQEIHPEDEIFRVKTFIDELEKVQNHYFETLCGELNVKSEHARDLLFDYVYNSEHLDGFDDYLEKLGYTYEAWLALGA